MIEVVSETFFVFDLATNVSVSLEVIHLADLVRAFLNFHTEVVITIVR